MLAGGTRIVVVMVGLPARGKTYISYKVSRYLAWLGVNCRVFNVGEYRRKIVGAQLDHSFFDPHNPVAIEQRFKCAVLALNDMLQWFEDVHNGVAIYDATNSTRARRKMLTDECRKRNVEVMFCESWCDDNDLVDMNIREVKRTSPDYKGVQDVKHVMDDFHHRIDHYSEVYEPVGGDGTRPLAKKPYPLPPTDPTLEEYDERQSSYARKINVGSKVVINRITSYLESRIVYFLMNIHIATRSVLFSRHGESIYNLTQRLGGDPSLSPNGKKYADALPSLISKLLGDQPLTVWTSTMRRTNETAAGLPYKKMQWKALDELDAGLCDGLTYEDVEREYPEEYAMRDENKFEFRYRGGESYRDVVLRLEPVIMELERQQNIMIISHQAVLRCIYAYFLDIGPDELPYLKIPLHTVMKLTWTAYGCDIQTYKIDIDAVDTHRAKPKTLKRGGTLKASGGGPPAGAKAAAAGEGSGVATPVARPDGGAGRFPAHEQPLSSSVAAVSTQDSNAPVAPVGIKPLKTQPAKSPNAVSDTWDVDEVWTPTEDTAHEMPLPTPPTTNAPPTAKTDLSPRDKAAVDTGAIRSAFQSAAATPAGASTPNIQPASQAGHGHGHEHKSQLASADLNIQGVPSSLSVSGGHDQGCNDSHMGHVWPSQISPGITRENSRAPSPDHEDLLRDTLIHREESTHGNVSHAYPGRSDPRNGSPVYLSPSDYAASFEMHSHSREIHSSEGYATPTSDALPQDALLGANDGQAAGSKHEQQPVPAGAKPIDIPSADRAASRSGTVGAASSLSIAQLRHKNISASPTASEPPSRQSSSYHRQPLLANLKIDELHIAGHGNVDVVETTPTITLRYSSNVPREVQKQTVALKNELVGIEDSDDSDDLSGDSESAEGNSSAAQPPASIADCKDASGAAGV